MTQELKMEIDVRGLPEVEAHVAKLEENNAKLLKAVRDIDALADAELAAVRGRVRMLELHARCAGVFVRKLEGAIAAIIEETHATDLSLHARVLAILEERCVHLPTDPPSPSDTSPEPSERSNG